MRKKIIWLTSHRFCGILIFPVVLYPDTRPVRLYLIIKPLFSYHQNNLITPSEFSMFGNRDPEILSDLSTLLIPDEAELELEFIFSNHTFAILPCVHSACKILKFKSILWGIHGKEDLSAKSVLNYDQSNDGGRTLSPSISGDTKAFSHFLKASPEILPFRLDPVHQPSWGFAHLWAALFCFLIHWCFSDQRLELVLILPELLLCVY